MSGPELSKQTITIVLTQHESQFSPWCVFEVSSDDGRSTFGGADTRTEAVDYAAQLAKTFAQTAVPTDKIRGAE